MGAQEKFCLRWNDFESNISLAFRELREEKDFFDVTLACDDDQIQAHKVILSACSPFFRQILKRNRHEHPLLYLKGVKYNDLMSVLNFMYYGEVNVAQDELNSFLSIAEDLKVKGLTQKKSHEEQRNIHNVAQLTPSKPISLPRKTLSSSTAGQSSLSEPEVMHLQEDEVDYIQEVLPIKSEPVSHAQEQHAGEIAIVDTIVDNQISMYEEHYENYGSYEEDTYEGSMANKGIGNLDSYISKVKDDSGTIICYSCNCCGKTMARKDHMKNHIQTHFPQQEVGCEMCGVMCKNIPSLKVHISKFHRNVV